MEEVRRNWPFLRDRRIDAYGAHHEPVSVVSRVRDPRSGFRMPAEWEPHEATWIAWPHNADDWPGRFEPIPWVYGEIVRKLAHVERVRILVQTTSWSKQRADVLSKVGRGSGGGRVLSRADRPRVDARFRAAVRARTRAGEVAAVKWRFNGWAKYDNCICDDAAGRRDSENWPACDSWTPGMVLEGGSIDVNGAGLAADHGGVSAEPGSGAQSGSDRASRSKQMLRDYLGIDPFSGCATGSPATIPTATSTTWRASPIAETMVIASEDDPADPNYEPLRENCEILKQYPFARSRSCRCPRR